MCWFVTLGIGASHHELSEIFDDLRIQVREANNPTVRTLLPRGTRTFYVLSGGCSCGFDSSASPKGSDPAKLRCKYRKKGWSDNKISRAIEQSVGRREAAREPELGALLRSGVARLAEKENVYLYAAFCSASPNDEPAPDEVPVLELTAERVAATPLPAFGNRLIVVLPRER